MSLKSGNTKQTENQKEQLQKGFNVNWQGANQDRISQQQQREIEAQKQNQTNLQRKKWQEEQQKNEDDLSPDLSIAQYNQENQNKRYLKQYEKNGEIDDCSLVNCTESMQEDTLNMLQQSLRTGQLQALLQQDKTKNQKSPGNDDIQEIYQDQYEQNDSDNEFEQQTQNQRQNYLKKHTAAASPSEIQEEIAEDLFNNNNNEDGATDVRQMNSNINNSEGFNQEKNRQTVQPRPISAALTNQQDESQSSQKFSNNYNSGISNYNSNNSGSNASIIKPTTQSNQVSTVFSSSKASEVIPKPINTNPWKPNNIKRGVSATTLDTSASQAVYKQNLINDPQKFPQSSTNRGSSGKTDENSNGMIGNVQFLKLILSLDEMKKNKLLQHIEKMEKGIETDDDVLSQFLNISSLSGQSLGNNSQGPSNKQQEFGGASTVSNRFINNESQEYESNPPPPPQTQPEKTNEKQRKLIKQKFPQMDEERPEQPMAHQYQQPEINVFSKKTEASTYKLNEQRDFQEIVMRVLSTWGHVHIAGLSEIQVFNDKGEKIEVSAGNILVRGAPPSSQKSLYQLTDGVTNSTDDNHMWTSNMPEPPNCLEIGIRLSLNIKVSGFQIWNFNQSMIQSIKGIREMEILIDGTQVWDGVIARGPGNDYTKFATIIKLPNAKINIPDEESACSQHNDHNIQAFSAAKGKSQEKDFFKQTISLNSVVKQTNQQRQSRSNFKEQNSPQDQGESPLFGSNHNNSYQSQPIISDPQKIMPTNISQNEVIRIDQQSLKEIPQSEIQSRSIDSSTYAQIQNGNPTDIYNSNNNNNNNRNSNIPGDSLHISTSNNNMKEILNNSKIIASSSSSQKFKGPQVLNPFDDFPSISSSKKDLHSEEINKLQREKMDLFNSKISDNHSDIFSQIIEQPQQQLDFQKKEPQTVFFNQAEKVLDDDDEDEFNNIIENKNEFYGEQNPYGKNHDQEEEDEDEPIAKEGMFDTLKLFNLTQQGRLKPERDRIRHQMISEDQMKDFMDQIQDVQKNVEEGLKNVRKVVDFQNDEKEYDMIDLFFEKEKKTKKQVNFKATMQSSVTSASPKIPRPPTGQSIQFNDIQTQKEMEKSIALKKGNNNSSQNFSQGTVGVSNQRDSDHPVQQSISNNFSAIDNLLDQIEKMNIEDQKDIKELTNKNNSSSTTSGNSAKPGLAPVKGVQIFSIGQQRQQIPILPSGKIMQLKIHTTWGDKYYVGLTGIEFWDELGEVICIQNPEKQLHADPPDINSQDTYGKDPRTIDKIIDETYLTCDDLHMWLAPFAKGQVNTITINFVEKKKISMIRIWNYNKSRIHSFRGVKDIQITLDGKLIFEGEIQKSSGNLQQAEETCQYILFTEEERTFKNIQQNDWLPLCILPDNLEEESLENFSQIFERPSTGNKNNNTETQSSQIYNDFSASVQPSPQMHKQGRPPTSVVTNTLKREAPKSASILRKDEKQMPSNIESSSSSTQLNNRRPSQSFSVHTTSETRRKGFKCQKLVVNILQNWGDSYYAGLTGLAVLDQKNQIIPITIQNLNAKPRDMNDIAGYSGDARTLDQLINGKNVTSDDQNMWMIAFNSGQPSYIEITFNDQVVVAGLRVWNYNKNLDDTIRGIQIINVVADGVYLTPQQGVLVRRAPGIDLLDFGQNISLPYEEGWSEDQIESIKQPQNIIKQIIQEYDTLHLPRGLLLKFIIHTTQGDIHYVGLNGLQIFDHNGQAVVKNKMNTFQIGADPPSINILKGQEKDSRTVDKLLNGNNETFDDQNMWLAPYVSYKHQKSENNEQMNTKNNYIYILFEKPIIISAITIWNYSKTPTRGVKEIQILLDQNIIYRGYLRKSPSKVEYKAGNSSPIDSTILFNRVPFMVNKIKPNLYTEDSIPQNVLFYNEKQLVGGGNNSQSNKDINQNSLPLERPLTMVGGGEY